MQDSKQTQRSIKSFVRRQGRMTATQKEALARLWPQFGLDIEQGMLSYDEIFRQSKEVVLEIGFGMGQSLVEMAQHNLGAAFIGIEVHQPGIGALFTSMQKSEVNNIRVYCHDAVEVLRQAIPNESLDRLQLFFPDPWPKKRHHKRRIVQPEFIELVASKLKSGGIFHAATDWENYAQHMLFVLEGCSHLSNQAGPSSYATRPGYRPETKFERRGLALGHGVWDIIFRLNTQNGMILSPI